MSPPMSPPNIALRPTSAWDGMDVAVAQGEKILPRSATRLTIGVSRYATRAETMRMKR